MSETSGIVAKKERTKVILAVLSMLTAVSISIVSLVAQYLDKGEEKADTAYQHLVEQVNFTDKQLIEIRKEIVEGDRHLREMVFELTLNFTKHDSKVNTDNAKSDNARLESKDSKSVVSNDPTSSIDDILEEMPSDNYVTATIAKQMGQRPSLPARLE